MQDFASDPKLKASVIDFLEEMVCNTNLLPTEHKAAAAVLRTISKDTTDLSKTDLTTLLQPIEVHNSYTVYSQYLEFQGTGQNMSSYQ